MLRVVRDLAVAVVGGASVGLVVAYSGHSTTLALWAALGGSIFVLATCFVIEHRRAVDTRPRPGLSTRPTATERVAHDILVDEFGRPSLPELRRALKAERRKGRELLASIRYSLKHPYGGKMDMELQDDRPARAGCRRDSPCDRERRGPPGGAASVRAGPGLRAEGEPKHRPAGAPATSGRRAARGQAWEGHYRGREARAGRAPGARARARRVRPPPGLPA